LTSLPRACVSSLRRCASRLRPTHRLAVVAACVTFTAMAIAPTAQGQDSPTISGAPAVTFGQQAFGNTAGPGSPYGGGCWGEGKTAKFWTLSATAGDDITIQMETQDFAIEEIALYGIGTNDFNFGDFHPLFEDSSGENRVEMRFTIPVSGTMPLMFSRCSDWTGGPYSFTAYVQHAVRLSVPRKRALRRKEVLSIGARTPDGGALNDPQLQVSVELRWKGRWRSVGTATALNGTAAVRLAIPKRLRGQRVSVRARAQGAAYKPVSALGGRALIR
jgi:hypothetical protein